MLQYKLEILPELTKRGYSSRRLRNENLLGEYTMTSLRRGEMISLKSIDTICRLLQCQPGDLLEWIDDEN